MKVFKHLQPPLMQASLQAPERSYVYNSQKPLLGLKWGLWGADSGHAMEIMIENRELDEIEDLK